MSFYQDGTVLTAAELDAAFAVKEPSIPAGTTSQYFRGDKTWQTLDKTAVGLSNVDNTSDADKPISTATQAALDGKLSDVANGNSGAGSVPLVSTPTTSPAGIDRIIAQIAPASTDVVVTAPTTAGDPVQIGLNGTSLKYWAEASQTISSTVQRLIWQPKDPNGTFVRANTIQVLAVPNALTLRDPSESGSTFPTGFTAGLDLQMKGSTGTATTIPTAGSYAFGEGNTVSNNSVGIGISNTVSAATGTFTYLGSSVVIGKTNTVAANASMVSGITNTIYGSGHLIFGQSNTTVVGSASAGLFGLGNSCSDTSHQYNFAFGRGNTVGTGGYAYGASNTATMAGSFAVGFSNSLTGVGGGSIAVGKSNTTTGFTNLLVGTSNSAAAASSNSIGIGNSNTNINGTIVLGLNNNGYQYAGGMILGASNTCTGTGSLSTIIGFNNNVTSGTQNQSIILGQYNSSGVVGNGNYNIGIGYAITQTSTGSLVVTGGAAGANDQGLSSFQAFGRKVSITATRQSFGSETTFTNYTWYDVPSSTFQVLNNQTGKVVKFSCNAYVSWRDAGGTTTLNQNRQAVLRVEAWMTDLGTLLQTVHVVEGGDSDFLTYFDLQLVLSGNGIKLQYRFVSDPTGGQTPYNGTTAPNGVKAKLTVNAVIDQITQGQ